MRFSCVDSFILSYFLSIFSNRGKTIFVPIMSATSKTGIAAAKIRDKSGLIEIDITIANTSIMGERTSIRMMI